MQMKSTSHKLYLKWHIDKLQRIQKTMIRGFDGQHDNVATPAVSTLLMWVCDFSTLGV